MAIDFEIVDNNTIFSIPLDKGKTVINIGYYYGDKVGNFISDEYPEDYPGGDLTEFEVIAITTGSIAFILKWVHDLDNVNIYSEISDALTNSTSKRIHISGEERYSFKSKLNVCVMESQDYESLSSIIRKGFL